MKMMVVTTIMIMVMVMIAMLTVLMMLINVIWFFILTYLPGISLKSK